MLLGVGRHFKTAGGSLLVVAIALSAGCALFSGSKPDPAIGQWDGHWSVGASTQPVGGLKATITPGEKRGEYKAVFDAEFGQRAKYEVPLEGKRQGEKIVFEGDVDLGAASGGVFNWTGEIAGAEFNGVYKSPLVSGTFKLIKTPDQPASP
jgi:hypothetical protein